jgi:hypothetical protein
MPWSDRDGAYIVTALSVKHLQDTTRARNALANLISRPVGRINDVPGTRSFVVGDFAPVVYAMHRLLRSMDKPGVIPALPMPSRARVSRSRPWIPSGRRSPGSRRCSRTARPRSRRSTSSSGWRSCAATTRRETEDGVRRQARDSGQTCRRRCCGPCLPRHGRMGEVAPHQGRGAAAPSGRLFRVRGGLRRSTEAGTLVPSAEYGGAEYGGRHACPGGAASGERIRPSPCPFSNRFALGEASQCALRRQARLSRRFAPGQAILPPQCALSRDLSRTGRTPRRSSAPACPRAPSAAAGRAGGRPRRPRHAGGRRCPGGRPGPRGRSA